MLATSSGQPPRCVPPAIGSGSKASGSAEGGSLSLFGNKMAGDGRTMVFLYTIWIHPLKNFTHIFSSKRPDRGFRGFCHFPGLFRTLRRSDLRFSNLLVTCKRQRRSVPIDAAAVLKCAGKQRYPANLMRVQPPPQRRRRAYPVKMTG